MRCSTKHICILQNGLLLNNKAKYKRNALQENNTIHFLAREDKNIHWLVFGSSKLKHMFRKKLQLNQNNETDRGTACILWNSEKLKSEVTVASSYLSVTSSSIPSQNHDLCLCIKLNVKQCYRTFWILCFLQWSNILYCAMTVLELHE